MPRPRLTTVDDVELAGRRWLTPGSPRAAVVLAHGFTATADDPGVEAVGNALHDTGLDVVSYDARGHGSSGGECTLGDHEQHDVAAAVELARTRSERVVVVGASMGAIAVLRHAATDPDLVAAIAVSCPARWQLPRNPLGVLSALLTRTPVGRAAAGRFLRVRIASRWTDPPAPVDLVPDIATPTVFIHGECDRFISRDDAIALHESARDPRRLVLVPEMGHAYDEHALGAITDAVEWALTAASAEV
jgi:alpha-beta hydrolase superfamily lysophospholipase